MHRCSLAAAAAAALIGAALSPSPADARPALPPLGVNLVRLSPTTLTFTTVCPVDPPTTVFATATLDGTPTLLGSEPFTCVRTRQQRGTITLDTPLPLGSTVEDLSVTVSGDGGEISGFFGTVTVSRTPQRA